jgi:site-specific DNA recombinase
MAERRFVRCAIYTRKSTEYGLEQDFNSLDAQREAAEAYIRSQVHEGWSLVPVTYDDGGLSGGTLERPALQALLTDVRAGKIDVVVVYKVDRLTRSLADFAKLVELFDKQGVSFVSVTQQFNTTSSMGRLTLNVLLSFAQFEREVTAERIRDKIEASKKKGIWVGGPVALGYAVKDRKLVIVEREAEQVRTIFRRYLEVESLQALQKDLRARNIVSKVRTLTNGKTAGGIPFFIGSLAYLLKNRMYIGDIMHKGQAYRGQQPAILETDLFNAVQSKLASSAAEVKRKRAASDSLLIGKLFDDAGNRMRPTNTQKGSARYRYYFSGSPPDGGDMKPGSVQRVSAPDIEEAVLKALRGRRGFGQDPGGPTPTGQLPSDMPDRDMIEQLLDRVVISDGTIEVVLKHQDGDASCTSDLAQAHIELPFRTRSICTTSVDIGVVPELKTAVDGMRAKTRRTLLQSIVNARRWADDLTTGRVSSANEIAKRDSCSARHVTMTLPLAFLAPEIVAAAINNTLPPDLGALALAVDLPLSWKEQVKILQARPAVH